MLEKEVKMGKELAIQNMKQNILEILNLASNSSPFILETPAGQGIELLITYQEFSDFYKDIIKFDTKNKFKICIDTCHVFAAGNDPYDYIQNWIIDHGKESIALIHFNDSCGKQGCKKDRHKTPGEGEIGKKCIIFMNFVKNIIYILYLNN